MMFRSLVLLVLLLFLNGCGGRPTVMPTLPAGIPLAEVCNRYHVTWEWDGVTQVVLMQYKGNTSKALVGSSTVLIGQQKIILSSPLRREHSTIYVPEDFEAKVLAPFGVPVIGLPFIAGSSRVHVVVVDAGHGGKDRGTISPSGDGMDEKEIVLDVAKRLRELLESAGIKVIMTRDTDEFISLPERTIITSRSKADLFVSIHVNANRDHSVSGFLVYYLDSVPRRDLYEDQKRENSHIFLRSLPAGDSPMLQTIVSDMMSTLKTSQSQKLARSIVREAREAGDIKVRDDGMRLCHFFVVRNTLLPAVLVETGFLSNHQERSKLAAPSYRQQMAEVIARGVLDYANE